MGTLSLPRKVSVLGSTGSIGVSTLDLFDQAGVEVEIVGLTAGRNVARLAEQALRWRPQVAVIQDETLLPELRERLKGSGIASAAGAQAVIDVAAADAQWVMSAIVGFAGLAPTLAAAKAGAVIALANKESLVCAGPTLLRIAKLAGGAVIPVDSEHSAIFQVLDPLAIAQVTRLILTSSGGPFRDASREQMAAATLEQALAHPNFSMGAKISIDSATMMNKGLEVIEAAYLFSMPPERIDVLVHPQQIIHSLVEYADGSTLAQLGLPDMRPPIACAFAWPDRLPWPAPKLDLVTAGPLTFQHPDPQKFPALSIAKQALAAGGQAPAAMNAANERAVAAFLDRRIRFLDIPNVVAETLERMDRTESGGALDGDAVERARNTDAAARRVADEVVGGLVAA
ncbi:MAG: 1-deoxy-D-xylulose-5-phosphate reductoisomerase [Alphaproteobacteria bacterium]|nr:1-deoxy-D-xylulose-5-phosphate reductoisomerase [Alphaproteobacteria bacterium]MBU1513795.1 1-deoxy-D-xylulose-5-phosphate reductoisomerase [Alphaproteobacteria bacterium]MBU2094560.1 1-deoxy-D-xylulose-5-phosphate reductoisomerase [Alphaproteobacteria bacterium]MBU2149681.1 1-deoxy-D-xylulose-5-phosphate reductoisomerase [Alphaproteobacteria bacterium]MBU2309100.1 1-deoxy-D-xylulose-5-phosphate reductoisomerase [Alphaproteobacteria bacterium]